MKVGHTILVTPETLLRPLVGNIIRGEYEGEQYTFRIMEVTDGGITTVKRVPNDTRE